MTRLVIVSNRLPPLHSKICAGGLAMAFKAALAQNGGLWFGWSGFVKETAGSDPRIEKTELLTLAKMDLSMQEFRGYYQELANRTLWPLFHGRLDLCRWNPETYDIYQQVNTRFAHALYPLLEADDRIWVQDYHLIPHGRELRRLGVAAPIGFFLHVPYPQTVTFGAFPWHRELLSDLCAYDLVGFQTSNCAENFREAVLRYLGGSVRCRGGVVVDGHVTKVRAFPISIDTRTFKEMCQSSDVQRHIQRLRDRMHGRRWLCGVERLDYTKGLAERFRAFELALSRAPALHDRVSLVQIAAPSRESVPEYQDMRRQLESLSGRINGRFGTFDWTPIQYLNRSYGQKQLAALYRVSRVGLVTPLRDGMNLVAKEYVAAQDSEDPGVLILSQFAGAAHELSEALLVNPFDTSAVAEAILRALEMPLEERRMRWKPMMHHLETNNVHLWRRAFLESLEAAHDQRSGPRAARAA